MNPVLEDIYRSGKCVDLAGKERKVTGAVPREDALILQDMIRFVKAKTTLETGVAFGLSTLAICETLKEVAGAEAKHYGVDPEQHSVHGGAALASLKRAGLDSAFELLEGPSHLMLPKLLEKGVTLDLAFIDGWHTFDYTLLDFFYLDKMLRPGGVMLLHDRSWPSKQKVMRFIMTHRRYKELPVRSSTKPGFFKWLRRVVAAKWHWLKGAPFGIVTAAIANRPRLPRSSSSNPSSPTIASSATSSRAAGIRRFRRCHRFLLGPICVICVICGFSDSGDPPRHLPRSESAGIFCR